MFVQVNMSKYNTGKRKKKKGYQDFEVREEFWENLLKFAKNDFVSFVTDMEKQIQTCKTEEFINLITSIARTEDELQIVDDLRYCNWGSNVFFENTFISSTLLKRVAEIKEGYATFYSNKTGKQFKVKIADAIKDNVKIGDEVVITILMNKNWVVTEVIE